MTSSPGPDYGRFAFASSAYHGTWCVPFHIGRLTCRGPASDAQVVSDPLSPSLGHQAALMASTSCSCTSHQLKERRPGPNKCEVELVHSGPNVASTDEVQPSEFTCVVRPRVCVDASWQSTALSMEDISSRRTQVFVLFILRLLRSFTKQAGLGVCCSWRQGIVIDLLVLVRLFALRPSSSSSSSLSTLSGLLSEFPKAARMAIARALSFARWMNGLVVPHPCSRLELTHLSDSEPQELTMIQRRPCARVLLRSLSSLLYVAVLSSAASFGGVPSSCDECSVSRAVVLGV